MEIMYFPLHVCLLHIIFEKWIIINNYSLQIIMQAQSVYKFPKGLQKFIYNRHKKLTEIIWGSQVMLLALMLIGLISTFV